VLEATSPQIKSGGYGKIWSLTPYDLLSSRHRKTEVMTISKDRLNSRDTCKHNKREHNINFLLDTEIQNEGGKKTKFAYKIY
jgi:hypothetical protein